MRKTKVISIGFIGAGYMAEEHMRVFSKIPNTELSAIYSRTPKKAANLRAKYKIKKNYINLNEFCNSSKIKLVVIAVNEESLLEICKKTFKFNFIHLIEKPVGINYEESVYILDLAKKYKTKVFVSLNRRFYSSTIKLKKLLKSDKNKRIINIIDQENTIIPLKNGINKNVVNNWMYANSIHLIDFAYNLSRGNIIKIDRKIISKYSNIKFLLAQIYFSSGDIVNYQAFWNLTAPWSVSVSTRSKYYLMQPIEKLSYKNNKSHNFINFPITKEDIKYKPGIYKQNYELIDSLLNKNKFSLPNIIYSNKLMKLINGIYF